MQNCMYSKNIHGFGRGHRRTYRRQAQAEAGTYGSVTLPTPVRQTRGFGTGRSKRPTFKALGGWHWYCVMLMRRSVVRITSSLCDDVARHPSDATAALERFQSGSAVRGSERLFVFQRSGRRVRTVLDADAVKRAHKHVPETFIGFQAQPMLNSDMDGCDHGGGR